MSEKKLITDLIDSWKPRQALADEIGANLPTVHKWAASNRIPSDWQAHVVRAAHSRGMSHINGDWMIAAHERKERVS